MPRADDLQRLSRAEPWDVLVVGGGATGLGVAYLAAQRGWRVALLEAHDFASGTSSRSTKLLHGGVRYLAQGHWALVREALTERERSLLLAPHLAQPLPFIMPCYRRWQLPFYGLGLKLYQALAGRASLGPTRWLGPKAAAAALPGLQTQGLQGAVQYWDAQFEDARLALALARSAAAAGALVLNYVAVQALHAGAHGPSAEPADATRGAAVDGAVGAAGGVQCLTAVDQRSGARLQVRSRCVVNATGVWVDALRQQALVPGAASALVQPSQGVHLVVARDFMPAEQALLVPRTADGRVLFAVPWLGHLVLGSTDTPRTDLPREPEPFAEEVDFILREAARVLTRPPQRADVRSVWVGLRPLVAAPGAGSGAGSGAATQALSREHQIVVDGALVTVTGGKWTTWHAMAQEVLQHAVQAGLLPQRAAAPAAAALFGAPHAGAGGAQASTRPAPMHRAPGLHLYGGEAAAVQALPGAGRVLGLGLTEAMVRYAVRFEWALTVEDVLARRWRALFLDAAQAGQMVPSVARIMREEHAASGQAGLDVEQDAFVALTQRYLLRSNPALKAGNGSPATPLRKRGQGRAV